jgi:cardiolipin synthase
VAVDHGEKRRDLLAVVTAVARELPEPLLQAVCDALEPLPGGLSSAERQAIAAKANAPRARAALADLLDRWTSGGAGMSPAALAWALRASAVTHSWHHDHQSRELVWTGPVPMGTTLRRTDQALLELIRGARMQVTVVTFAAYRVPAIRKALLEASQRGVRLRFILESVDASKGKVTVDAIQGFGEELARTAEVWSWPLDARPRDTRGHHGALHAKCAVADDDTLLVSSANFTEHAMELNMELGLLIRGGDLPSQVARNFDALIAAGTLQRTR